MLWYFASAGLHLWTPTCSVTWRPSWSPNCPTGNCSSTWSPSTTWTTSAPTSCCSTSPETAEVSPQTGPELLDPCDPLRAERVKLLWTEPTSLQSVTTETELLVYMTSLNDTRDSWWCHCLSLRRGKGKCVRRWMRFVFLFFESGLISACLKLLLFHKQLRWIFFVGNMVSSRCLTSSMLFFRELQSEDVLSAWRRRLWSRPQQAEEAAAVGSGGSGRHGELRPPDRHGVHPTRPAGGAGGTAGPANNRIPRGGGRGRLRRCRTKQRHHGTLRTEVKCWGWDVIGKELAVFLLSPKKSRRRVKKNISSSSGACQLTGSGRWFMYRNGLKDLYVESFL